MPHNKCQLTRLRRLNCVDEEKMDETLQIYYASKPPQRIPIGSQFPATPDIQKGRNNEIGSTQVLHKDKECNFHYFHFLLKVGTYCGMIPLHLSFNQANRHYQVSKMNIFLRVCFYFQAVFSPNFEHACYISAHKLFPLV